jgi:hypothetical protein
MGPRGAGSSASRGGRLSLAPPDSAGQFLAAFLLRARYFALYPFSHSHPLSPHPLSLSLRRQPAATFLAMRFALAALLLLLLPFAIGDEGSNNASAVARLQQAGPGAIAPFPMLDLASQYISEQSADGTAASGSTVARGEECGPGKPCINGACCNSVSCYTYLSTSLTLILTLFRMAGVVTPKTTARRILP